MQAAQQDAQILERRGAADDLDELDAWSVAHASATVAPITSTVKRLSNEEADGCVRSPCHVRRKDTPEHPSSGCVSPPAGVIPAGRCVKGRSVDCDSSATAAVDSGG